MAIKYVYSGAGGAANGSSWTDAYTTIQAALTAWTTSDVIWVAHDHSETTGSALTLTCGNASSTEPCRMYRVNRTTNIYDPAPQDNTGADQIILTGTFTNFTINFDATIFGLKFSLSYGYYSGSGKSVRLYDCEINIGNVSSAPEIQMSANGEFLSVNCYWRNIITTNSTMEANGVIKAVFQQCTFAIASASAGWIQPVNGVSGTEITFEDCDLTLLTNTKIVDTSDFNVTNYDERHHIIFRSCKLRTSYELWDGVALLGTNVRIIAEACSANGATTYINQEVNYRGLHDTSITCYLDTGYTDYDGDTALSVELTPSAKCTPSSPIRSPIISGVLAETGSKTFTIQGVENFTTALTAEEMWVELYYYGDAGATYHALDDSTREKALLTYTTLTAGDGTTAWTGEPTGSRSFQLSTTVTIGKAGYYHARVYLGKYEAGKVAHINPAFEIT